MSRHRKNPSDWWLSDKLHGNRRREPDEEVPAKGRMPKEPCSECAGKGCEFCTTGTREPYIGADPGMEVGGTTHKRLSTEEEGYGL